MVNQIDHQQAAIRAAARAIAPHAYDKALWRCTLADGRSMEQTASDAEVTATNALAAATPHLRAAWAEQIRDEVNMPPGDFSDDWRSGFVLGVLKSARILEGGGE